MMEVQVRIKFLALKMAGSHILTLSLPKEMQPCQDLDLNSGLVSDLWNNKVIHLCFYKTLNLC